MGFASNSPISVTTTVGTSTVFWFTNQGTCGAFTNNAGGNNGIDSLIAPASSPASGCLTTTASGEFKSAFNVPALPGGSETIVVSDGTNTVSVPFTITQKVSFSSSSTNNYGFPETNVGTGTFTLTGFGASELVTVSTTAFTAASFATVSCTTSAFGSCSFTDNPLVVADTTGGSKAISAVGGTSGLTASASYTVKPWAAFYNSAGGATTFSFAGSAPTSLLIEVHGMPSGTIPANSITVGGVGTSHAAVTIGSTGAVGGAGNQIVVSPTANVPFGSVSVVVGGTTFNYATGNIAVGTTPWGGALISSIAGTISSTGVVQIDAANYKPALQASGASKSNPAPQQNQIGFFAYGFVPSTTGTISSTSTCGGTGGAISSTNGGAALTTTFQVGNCLTGTSSTSPEYAVDTNGAFFAKGILGDTPWSSAATPTTAATYNPMFSQATTAPANVLNPSFGITPWIDTSKSTVISSTVDYSTTTAVGFTAHGFSASEGVTFTVGGTTVIPSTAGTCTSTTAGLVSACGAATAKMPDLAAGPQNLVATGGLSGQSVTSTGAIQYDPRIDNQPGTSGTTALSSIAGSAGSTTILRTGTNYGVHGLYASTAYQIVWNEESNSPGKTGQVLATFTSTATGGIPVPGVQFAVPADTSGIHIIGLERTSAVGTSFMYDDNLAAVFNDPVWATAFGTPFQTNYGDMLFNLGTSLVVSPTVANVGSSLSLSGTGLSANTAYDLGISQAGTGNVNPASSSNPPATCSLSGTGPAPAPTTIAGTFTSTSAGAVPAGTSVSVTDTPTVKGLEQGTLYCVFAQTAATFGGSTAVGVAQFELQASENLNMTSAPIGHNVILNAHALAASTGYNVIFAPFTTSSGNVIGTVVGAILSNAQGAGSGTFTVPSTIQTASGSQATTPGGSYVVELQSAGSSTSAIASPATLTVGSTSVNCNSTTCTTPGTSSTTTLNGNPTLVVPFTNNSNQGQTVIVYGVVHNALGQTVYYTTSTITPGAGGSATAYLVLAGLPHGTYTVSYFAVSASGIAVSTSGTATVTV